MADGDFTFPPTAIFTQDSHAIFVFAKKNKQQHTKIHRHDKFKAHIQELPQLDKQWTVNHAFADETKLIAWASEDKLESLKKCKRWIILTLDLPKDHKEKYKQWQVDAKSLAALTGFKHFAAVALHNSQTWLVFGGMSNKKKAVNTTWLYTPGSPLAEITCNNQPRARFGHTLTVYKSGAILYGGQSATEHFSDVWMWMDDSWTLLSEGNRAFQPQSRAYHGAFIIEDNLMVLGGQSESAALLDDCWEFDLTAQNWHRVVLPKLRPCVCFTSR